MMSLETVDFDLEELQKKFTSTGSIGLKDLRKSSRVDNTLPENKLQERSQKKLKEEVNLTSDISEYQDFFDQAKHNRLGNYKEVEQFFQKMIADKERFNIQFEASCDLRTIGVLRKLGPELFRSRESIKTDSQVFVLGSLIDEIVSDAEKHNSNLKNATFFVKIEVDPQRPANFSILVINPCQTETNSIQFMHQTGEFDEGSGLGTTLKSGLARDLGGVNSYIDIMDKGEKKFHGFKFERLK